MRLVPHLAPLVGAVVLAGLAVGGPPDGPVPSRVGPPAPARPAPPAAIPSAAAAAAPAAAPAAIPFAAQEAAALALVRQHLPELLAVLEPLKVTKPAEYRKAIGEIAAEARTLDAMQARNPGRAALALDAWKSRTHVELIAAQLAQTLTPERSSELRAAIEARVEVDVRRHQFEADQAEAALARARENLARAELSRDRSRDALLRITQNRDARVEARFRALQPKKVAPATRPGADAPKAVAPLPPMPMPMPTTSLRAQPLSSPEATAEEELR